MFDWIAAIAVMTFVLFYPGIISAAVSCIRKEPHDAIDSAVAWSIGLMLPNMFLMLWIIQKLEG